MPAPSVELYVNDTIYSGWEDISVTQSIKALSRGFKLSCTPQWDATSAPWPILPGDECELLINGQTVIDGYADDFDPSIGEKKTVEIAGRDLSADIVDCSAVYPTSHFNRPIDIVSLANILGKPYGVTASANVSTGQPLEGWGINPGETVFANLDRAARMLGLLMMSDGQGGILFTRAGTVASGYQLVEGQNILSASAKYSQKSRFSNYVVQGIPGTGDQNNPEIAQPIFSTATDQGVTRFRKLVITEDGQTAQIPLNQRAQWEASTRAGKSQTVQVSITGFTKPNGNLWVPNELISVTSPFLRLSNAELLITDVTFRFSNNGGSITNFELTRKDAYTLLPTIGTQQQLWNQAAGSQ